MTEFPWTASYPDGVRTDLGPVAERHLPDLLRQSAGAYGDQIAFTQVMPNGMNGSLRYREVDRLSDEFAVYLREVAGLRTGDRVAVQMPNCLSYPVVAFGVLKAGCVLVNTNPLYTRPEMVHQFADSGARALVISDIFADRLPDVLPSTSVETVVTVPISAFFPTVVAGIIRATQRYWQRSLPPVTVEHTVLRSALEQGRERLAGADLDAYLADVDLDTVAAL